MQVLTFSKMIWLEKTNTLLFYFQIIKHCLIFMIYFSYTFLDDRHGPYNCLLKIPTYKFPGTSNSVYSRDSPTSFSNIMHPPAFSCSQWQNMILIIQIWIWNSDCPLAQLSKSITYKISFLFPNIPLIYHHYHHHHHSIPILLLYFRTAVLFVWTIAMVFPPSA